MKNRISLAHCLLFLIVVSCSNAWSQEKVIIDGTVIDSSLSHDYPRSIISEGESWIISENAKSEETIGLGYLLVARGYTLLSQDQKAIAFYQKAIAEFQQSKLIQYQDEAKIQLAEFLISQGRLEESEEYCLEVLYHSKGNGDLVHLVSAYNGLGVIFRIIDENSRSLQYFNLALEKCAEANDAKGFSLTYKNLGTYYFNERQFNKAMGYYTKALKYWETQNIHEEKCGLINNIGNVYREMGYYDQALSNYLKAYEMSSSLGSAYLHTVIIKNLGLLAHRMGMLDKAKQLFDISFQMADKYKIIRVQQEVLLNEAKLLAEKGDFSLAYDHMKQVQSKQDTLIKNSRQQSLLHLFSHFEKQKEEEFLERTNQNIDKMKAENLRNYIYLGVLLLLLAVFLMVMIYYNAGKLKLTRALQKQKDEILSQKEKLSELNVELIRSKNQLENQISQRTYELQKSNSWLKEEIEERKMAVQLLHDQQEYTMELFNSFADPVFIKDAKHKWIHCNEAFSNLIGVPIKEIIGKSDYDYFSKEQSDVFWAKDKQVLDNGVENIDEEYITSTKGETFLIETKKKMYRNKRGEKFIVGIIRDITEKKNLEEQIINLNIDLENQILERTLQLQLTIKKLENEIETRKLIEKELIEHREMLEQSDKLKSNFLSNISHELRTPLNGILGNAELIRENKRGDKNYKMADKILTSGKRLLNTLDSIILVSQLQSGRVVCKVSRFNLSDILGPLFEEFHTAAVSKGLSMNLNCKDPVPLESDPEHLTLVMRQLLDNAVKFTQEGAIIIAVEKHSVEEKEGVLITVDDEGIGIGENEGEILFDPFRQLSEGWGRHYEGNGLGLTIARDLMKLLQGKVWYEKKESRGSRFVVWLPTVSST